MLNILYAGALLITYAYRQQCVWAKKYLQDTHSFVRTHVIEIENVDLTHMPVAKAVFYVLLTVFSTNILLLYGVHIAIETSSVLTPIVVLIATAGNTYALLQATIGYRGYAALVALITQQHIFLLNAREFGLVQYDEVNDNERFEAVLKKYKPYFDVQSLTNDEIKNGKDG